MKNKPVSFVLAVSILISHACTKEVAPTVITGDVINITGTSAICGGTITDEGSGNILSRGVCWSTNANPTINDNKTSDGFGTGTFLSELSDLTGATTYYVRAYATNYTVNYKYPTGYGNIISFTTSGQSPTVETFPATNIAITSATLNGTVKANYLSTEVVFEYGPTESYGQTITASQSPVTGNNFIDVSGDINMLSQGSVYHFRVKAVNALGTAYGGDMIFTTSP
jgi:hypothetical protein